MQSSCSSNETERSNLSSLARHHSAENQKTDAHSDTNLVLIPLCNESGSHECTEYSCDQHGNKCKSVNLNESEEQECLQKYRESISDIQSSRNINIFDGTSDLEQCAGCSIRADTQSIKEVGNKTYHSVPRSKSLLLCPFSLAFFCCKIRFNLHCCQRNTENHSDYAKSF